MSARQLIPPDHFYYLATPYSKYPGGLVAAFIDAARLTGQLIKQRHLVFSPICHAHPMSMIAGLDPLDHELWLELDLPMMRACTALLVAELPGWRDSVGVAFEIAQFRNMARPVWRLDPISLKVIEHGGDHGQG